MSQNRGIPAEVVITKLDSFVRKMKNDYQADCESEVAGFKK